MPAAAAKSCKHACAPYGWMLPQVARLPESCRMIRIKNVLTRQEDVLEVPGEERLADIRRRYQATFNAHAAAYIWKAFVKNPHGVLEPQELDMSKSLAANGIPDESADFEKCRLAPDFHIPVLHLYWSDDLTVA
jgi:hypothetical protein